MLGRLPFDSLSLGRRQRDGASGSSGGSFFSQLWHKVQYLWVSFEVKMGWTPKTNVNGDLPTPIQQNGFRTILAVAPHPGDTSLNKAAFAVYDSSTNQQTEKSAISKMSAADQQAVVQIRGLIAEDPRAQLAFQDLIDKDHLDGGTAADGTTLLQNLQQLASEPLAPGLDRSQLLAGFIEQVANPMDTFQGDRDTCVPAVASMYMAQRYPAELARVLVGLASPQGTVQLANGDTLTRSSDWNASDGGRSQSEKLLEPAFIGYAVSSEDLTYDNSTDTLFQNGTNTGQSGLTANEANTLLDGLTDSSFKEVDFYNGRDPKTVASTISQIQKLANSGDPVPVGVDWIGSTGHKIMVENISNNVVTYLNPYGMREQMSLSDFSNRLENANLPTGA